MKVIEISASVKEHKSKCISEFLKLWFAGQIPGMNVPAMNRKKGLASPQKLQSKKNINPKLIADCVRQGLVFVNEKRVPHLPFFLQGKAKILIAFKNEQIQIDSNSFDLQKKHILYEDNELIAVNKPSGVASQSSFHLFEDHMKALVYEYYLKNLKGIKAPYLALCHRLDKDTSGTLLFAKKKTVNKGMSELFSQRKIKKTYLAIVACLEESQLKIDAKFKVQGLIKKTPTNKHPFYFSMSQKEGKSSETHFKVLQAYKTYRLLECRPLTGRSHQIRVHLKSVKRPILGDAFYNPETTKSFSRLALHSQSLCFKHPLSGKNLQIFAPMPEYFRHVLSS